MGANIARFAKGFLDLLGLQNFGEAPRFISDQVVPTVEIGELYLSDLQRTGFGGTTGNLVNGYNSADVSAGVPLQVPAGEVWRILLVSAFVIPAAGASGLLALTVNIENNEVLLTDHAPYIASTTTGITMKTGPFWAQAGYRFGFDARQVVGNAPASLQLMYARLRA